MTVRATPALLVVALGTAGGCDFLPPNMSDQARGDPYEPSDFFADGRVDRRPVEGTVPRGDVEGAEPLEPLDDAERILQELHRGRVRFGVHCAPCHGLDGSGRGMIVERGFPRPPSLHTPRLRGKPDAYIEDVIVHGRGTMAPYGKRVPTRAERRAIVLYVRALQRSRNARLEDVPPGERRRLERAGAEEGR